MKYDHTRDYDRVAAAIYWLFLERNVSRFGGRSLAQALDVPHLTNKDQYCIHKLCENGFLSTETLFDEFDGEPYTVYNISPGIIDYVNGYVDDSVVDQIYSKHRATTSAEDSANEAAEPDWEPIQTVDEDAKQEVVEAVEAAINAVERDNGYSMKHPEERDTIAASLRTGIDLLKNYKPTKRQIESLIVAPLKRIITVFGQHFVAEAAKKAVDKIMSTVF